MLLNEGRVPVDIAIGHPFGDEGGAEQQDVVERGRAEPLRIVAQGRGLREDELLEFLGITDLPPPYPIAMGLCEIRRGPDERRRYRTEIDPGEIDILDVRSIAIPHGGAPFCARRLGKIGEGNDLGRRAVAQGLLDLHPDREVERAPGLCGELPQVFQFVE